MTTFVLVPGAWHGGWWFAPLAQRLADAGHDAVPVTLDGLDPDAPAPTSCIDLDRHVAQVVDAVRTAPGPGRDVVLVGHSYEGSLITGAADADPDRVRALVYLDAFLPADGDSCWSMANEEERGWYVDGARRTGVAVDPFPLLRPPDSAAPARNAHAGAGLDRGLADRADQALRRRE